MELNRNEHVTALQERLDAHLRGARLLPPGSALTIALSGGLDSVALVELLLRLRSRWGWRLTAAHFDHRMRPGSGEDAAWVERRCRAWGIPVLIGRAERALRGEADAREARYAFLLEARARLEGEVLVTAHHADDQVETVLLRLLRGSPLEGLAGMPAVRRPRVARPLLPFWRHELEAYAIERGLRYREDPTNGNVAFARNRVRHRLLPLLEEAAGPAVKDRLLGLGAEADRARRVWSRFLSRVEGNLDLQREPDRLVVAAPRLSAYDESTRAQLLRRWVRALRGALGRGGLLAAQDFLRAGTSGGAVTLGSGVVLRREYYRFVLERAEAPAPDRPITVRAAEPGEGMATVGGRRYRVTWGGETPAGVEHCAAFDPSALAFPVVVRGWQPGDRIVRAAGSRSLKRLFNDRRVPRSERRRGPVVADAQGVVWVPGVDRSVRASPSGCAAALYIGVSRVRWCGRDRTAALEWSRA